MPSLTSLVGGATAAYSAALVVAPRLLLEPCGLEQSADARTLTRAIGARDVALGLAMVAAPAGPARWVAAGCRVAADWSDAAVFGAALAGRGTRGKVVGFAGAWGALGLVAAVLDARSGRQAPRRRRQWPVSALARSSEAMISCSAASRPTHSAPSTDLPGSRSL